MVAESVFQFLKREWMRRRIYPTRDDARRDAFDDIETLYNPKRTHANDSMLSLVNFNMRRQKLTKAGVQEMSGTSKTLTRDNFTPY